MAVGVQSVPEIPLISLVTSTPEDVLRALSTVGFILLDVQGTGITQDDIDRAFELSSLIHSIPLEKMTACFTDHRGNGYLEMKGSLDERKTGRTDLRESFVWGRFKSTEGEYETTQALPSSIQMYKQEIVAFDEKCFEASLKVLDMLSRAFDVCLILEV
jgi:isopenicillin N synthase-like dioxygenase